MSNEAITEDEAQRSKYCPMAMARSAAYSPSGDMTAGGPDYCHGSNCMAWRWAEPEPKAEYRTTGGVLKNEAPKRRGRCGMVP